ncbi:MAG: hypothetical protein JSW55_01390 [Chloroflexota bacterium]|nr:MAG: hypothetical protein JSW55_01390 [Chloroflexota bacterium]
MENEDKEPKDDESESSADDNQSIGWLEVLAEEPGAIWDQTAQPSPETSEDLQPRPDQSSNESAAGAENQETVDRDEEAQADPEQGGTVAGVREAAHDDSVSAGQDLDSWLSDQKEAEDLGDEVFLENDDLMWLDEMDTVPRMNSELQEGHENRLTSARSEPVDDLDQGEETSEFTEGRPATTEVDEVPEDPDEAVAWLERLAAKQGASSEELPSVQSAESPDVEMAAPVEAEFDLPDEEAGEIPEDPDEAMAWLERLAAKQGVYPNEMTTAQVSEESTEMPPLQMPDEAGIAVNREDSPIADLDEALDWLEELTIHQEPGEERKVEAEEIPVTDEPPTPEVAHDVEEAMAGADLLFSEPESELPAEAVGDAMDKTALEEGEDAMAWLEQLAARQGAPVEELTTFEEEAVTDQVEAEMAQETAATMGEQVEADDLVEASGPEPELAEVVEPDEAIAADELVELSADGVDDKSETEAIDSVAVDDVPAEDLAWLDTLGDVDAESWLEAEATVEHHIDATPESLEAPVIENLDIVEEELVAPRTLATILPETSGAEELAQAREAMQEGTVAEGLAVYSEMVEKGESLAFLIDDLETFREEWGPEPRLQRVLGDAYARNGQLKNALRVYREALDNL